MKKLILIFSLLLASKANALDLSIHDFKETPDAPISKQLLDRAIVAPNADENDKSFTADLLKDCKLEHFTSGIRGNMRAIYSNEDECDGGNSFGLVIDISTGKITHTITDSEVEVK